MIKQIKSRTLSRRTKALIYKTLIRPVLTYGSETWTLTKADERIIDAFERKILRRIYGGIITDGEWRRRTNQELYSLFQDESASTFIRVGRLRWAGHVARMDPTQPARQLLDNTPGGRRSAGRPKLRWLDDVTRDANAAGASNWRNLAQDRGKWRRFLEEAKTHPGLSGHC